MKQASGSHEAEPRFTEARLQREAADAALTPGRPPRLDVVFQSYDPPLYFLTICSYRRRRLFDNAAFHEAFRQFVQRGYTEKGVGVGRYVLMPDHLHLFVRGGSGFVLSQWGRIFKQVLGKVLTDSGHQGVFWQRGFFDHLIRNSESYAQKWSYVLENPVRAGLVSHAEDWPWQGEIVVIDRP